eukprot:scaffold28108_cov61-Phaeocystis_antarctica.AAC.1
MASEPQSIGSSGRSTRSRSSERRAPPTLTLKRAIFSCTADGSSRSVACSLDTGTWPHCADSSKHAAPSSLMLTPNEAKAVAQSTGLLPPNSGSPGCRSVQWRSPLKTSKRTPKVRPVAASQMARCRSPSTVSVILPWAKPGFTGRNCECRSR